MMTLLSPEEGGRLLSREEEAEARAEAEEEFDREQRLSKKGGVKGMGKKKGNKKPFGDEEDDLGFLFGEGVTGKLPKYANRITLKNISPNMKLWGVITEVNSKDLVVSLPGGLRGFVRSEEAADIVLNNKSQDAESNLPSRIFHVGQLVPGIVLQVDDDKRDGKGNKRILLSLRLSLLYKGLTLEAVQDGMVKSIEDHGYILRFGVSSFSGFLPRSCLGGGKATVGQLIQGVVKSIDKARAVVHLDSDPELVSKSVIKDLKGLSIDQLVPGMMVNARVHSTLENGIMFIIPNLLYWNDVFHLQDSFPSSSWKDDYKHNKKVSARILFIDPTTRAVGLTLNSDLVLNKPPPCLVKTGDICEQSRIVRVDKGIGLLLEIPSSPKPFPAYVHMIDFADEGVSKIGKTFKEGGHVRVRILGMRHLEGIAMGTLKASAFEGSVFTHSDVKPGMLVKAKVLAVENFGAIVQFSSGVKALCPLPHMSEFDIVKPDKKFKLLFRVLGCKSKRITVTHKKTLVKSKLNVLSSYADAIEGLIAHGWITKIEKHGCFVRFYNGVHGFAHRSELRLDPGSEPDAVYHTGQVVKCRVISSVPASRKINLSFFISPKGSRCRTSEDGVCKLGSLVSGVVERLTPGAVVVHVHRQATILKSLLTPGYEFDQLLVLDNEGNDLILSAKYSLIKSAPDIPSDISQVHPSSVVHGYICNLIETGCFVRFLGRLTGFSPKTKATDKQIDNLSDAFYLGQSARSCVLNVESEAGRIKLSLKQSTCFSTDVSLIKGYFLLEEKIAAMQALDAKNFNLNWVSGFKIGSVVEGEIQEKKEFGVVLSFKDHGDVVGFIAQHQLGGYDIGTGSVVRAFVLDIAKSDGLIDLSLKPELVSSATDGGPKTLSSKKKRRRADTMILELNDTANAVVEIVKENYLVLSLPDYNNVIGYAFIADYNTQKLKPKQFVNGQRVSVTVGELVNNDSSGRLLLLLNPQNEGTGASSSKRSKSSFRVGSVIEGEVVEIKPFEIVLKFGNDFRGRVHITEVDDDRCVDNPLSKFRIGEILKAQIVSNTRLSGKSKITCHWELSARSSLFAGTMEGTHAQIAEDLEYSVGGSVRGYVVKVDSEWVWITVARNMMARLFILDSSCEPTELNDFQKRYSAGQAVEARILSVDKEKKLLRLTLRQSSFAYNQVFNHQSCEDGEENKLSVVNGTECIFQGDIVGGRIKKVLPAVGGLLVQIGQHLHGKVHYTELADTWMLHPLSGYQEGQFVKCKVLEISRSSGGPVHVDLSLRASLLVHDSNIPPAPMDSCNKRFENFDDLQPDMEVQGYVKNVTAKGCFIMLSRVIDARIRLSNLSDGFVVNPAAEFPIGKLVCGNLCRVLSVDASSRRVDVTLRTETLTKKSKIDATVFNKLHVGDVISGQIRRIEPYGLFVTILPTNVVGLCHISELSDDHVDKIDSKYKAGDKVVAKILKVDDEKQRVSLGMKKSYLEGDSDIDMPSIHDEEAVGGKTPNGHPVVDLRENGYPVILETVQARVSVLPLQVSLDDSEALENDEALSGTVANVVDVVSKKNDKRMKKKAKEEREMEIAASEKRYLEKDTPKSVEEFEKLVRSSPNSSFVWIKYMAFMLSLADVQKAREIAERALRTINIRDEGEKLNVWIAYFNLENEYGNPPEESVKKTFQRALQYCDPKKLHLALLGMYERTAQQKLANELLEKMVKKFKNSCKVWKHYVQCLLKQQNDGVQSIVNRALLSLPRNKHIKFITQTAILEFKCGLPDRGRSLFEGVLREYPKRTDLWSVYLDQEICLGASEVIRSLFERATSLSLPPKRMKTLFKKYLEYEMAHGDDERIEHVKRKALEA
ncbi:putative suppressor of forked, tetratricopeptide-like helical domain superfamily [Dioscorea sansibarensis]